MTRKPAVKIYWQPFRDESSTGRIRFIAANGTCGWFATVDLLHQHTSDLPQSPCWSETGVSFLLSEGKCKSQRAAILRMRAYDRNAGYPKALLIGEL